MNGPDEPDPLLEAALSMVDDRPVDWPEALGRTPALGETLGNLRTLEALAEQYRAEDPAPEPAAIFTWGPLRVMRKLGEGTFAEVWEAWDPKLQRPVALKLRRHEFAAGSGSVSWLDEARKLARVRHEHVLAVYGADVHDGRVGLWTERIDGRTLEEILTDGGAWSAREAALAGLDLCAALAAVHAAGLAHGDVKTSNVMRVGSAGGGTRDAGRIVLMDFGTAHDASPAAARAASAGTPLASAPEVLSGAPLTPAADLYSLGVLLYRLVTGSYPVNAATLDELRAAHALDVECPLRTVRPDLPAAFVRVVERSIRRDPARRFEDAAGMERALAATLGAERGVVAGPVPRTRPFVAAGLGALLVTLAWAGTHFLPEWTRPRFRLTQDGPAVASRVLQTLHGSEDVGLFGSAVACPGDLDGDGIPELLVGAPGESSSAGRAYLYRGQADGTFRPWRRFEGRHEFGFAVAGVGDINGDGRPDFAISGPFDDVQSSRGGSVDVYFGDPVVGGRLAGRLEGPRSVSMFGYAVAGAGDIDHDGYADIVVGAPLDNLAGRDAGRAFVYRGGPVLHSSPDLVLGPGSTGSQFGISVAGVGDLNGDGFDDLAVGANADRRAGPGSGHVSVYFGGRVPDHSPGLDLYGSTEDTWFGIAVAAAGDMDGDGFDDLAVGAERAAGFERRSGTVEIFRGGQHPGVQPARILKGPRASSLFGHALAHSDLNGDGHPDLLVGASGRNELGSVAGEVLGYYGGRALDPRPELRLTGTEEAGNFGSNVNVLPGVAGEFARPLIGAPYSGPSEAGAVWVFALSRYAITRPHRGEFWRPGTKARVVWLGREPAMLEWSGAPGGPWRLLARDVGGREENSLVFTVPAGAVGTIQLRLRPADARAGGQAVSETIRLAAAPVPPGSP